MKKATTLSSSTDGPGGCIRIHSTIQSVLQCRVLPLSYGGCSLKRLRKGSDWCPELKYNILDPIQMRCENEMGRKYVKIVQVDKKIAKPEDVEVKTRGGASSSCCRGTVYSAWNTANIPGVLAGSVCYCIRMDGTLSRCALIVDKNPTQSTKSLYDVFPSRFWYTVRGRSLLGLPSKPF